jgi:glycerate-2-kinase
VDVAPLRADALACHAAAIDAVEPGRLVRRRLARPDGALVLDGAGTHTGPVVVVGAGKAARAMAAAVVGVVGPACRGGVVVVPHGSAGGVGGGVVAVGGAHPIPDAAGAGATVRVVASVRAADASTLVVVVVSGGASSLLVAPADGLSLADKQTLAARLVGAGAEIGALNAIRKHCSAVKGGGLARAAAGAAGVFTLVHSDVIGDDLATVGSGPAVPDPTTFADASAALARLLPADAVPAAVRERFRRGTAGMVSETPKPGDPAFVRTRAVLVGGNRDAVEAAAAEARRRGFAVEVVETPIGGDAAAVGRALAARIAGGPPSRRALVAGGETTVRAVAGGRGGRSQHLALAAATALAGMPIVLLAAGTDGVDGPTDAAGACVDGGTVARARARGLDPDGALAATDSNALLAATGDLVRTGPTGTNVADVVIALRAGE